MEEALAQRLFGNDTPIPIVQQRWKQGHEWGRSSYIPLASGLSNEHISTYAPADHSKSFGNGGKPCIRGLRVTVGTITGLVASGHRSEDILKMYPYLEPEDIPAALSYATWLAESYDADLQPT